MNLSPLKKLVSQTAIYGLSSILGRLLNYLLVPLYTRIFIPQEYGVVTEMYAYISFLIVIFTYGMETAYFRFAEKEQDKENVYNTSLLSLLFSSTLLSGGIIYFSQSIADFLQYTNHKEYVIWFALILGLDAVVAIPFAKLRQENKAILFASFKLINICVNIWFNLFFLILCPYLLKNNIGVDYLSVFYHKEIGVGYIFISNFIASGITLLLFLPRLLKINLKIDFLLWKKIFRYAYPLIIVGMAGIINETMDRILLKYLLPFSHEENLAQIGIYGACYKLSLMMTIFIQAFRFAAEPFFFKQSNESNAKEIYAKVMNYFVIAGCILFLGVMLFVDVIKFFIGEKYHEGLHIVPILLMANLCLGIYYNLSIWYKLTDKTNLGAWISIGGAIITLVLNYLWIPTMGYTGSARATFACYFLMMIASYFIGQKHYHVHYGWKKILLYVALSLAIYFISLCFFQFQYFINSILLVSFFGIIFLIEKNKKRATNK